MVNDHRHYLLTELQIIAERHCRMGPGPAAARCRRVARNAGQFWPRVKCYFGTHVVSLQNAKDGHAHVPASVLLHGRSS